LDRWVVRTAFKWFRRHPQHLERMLVCSINLSGNSLGDNEFLEFITRQIDKSNMPPEKICFEITETAAIANLTSATHLIKALRKLGCRFALDDFGSGLSSFAYLKNLPVDFLKIDGMFVKDMVEDPIDFAMVKAINDMGHVMGKQTIAEFVENDAILASLRKLGVDYAQGYGVAQPRPIEEMTMDTQVEVRGLSARIVKRAGGGVRKK
jgi:EAL domain-containing protein (putative c-di-GMP-specific phosphodiesterase class I)